MTVQINRQRAGGDANQHRDFVLFGGDSGAQAGHLGLDLGHPGLGARRLQPGGGLRLQQGDGHGKGLATAAHFLIAQGHKGLTIAQIDIGIAE